MRHSDARKILETQFVEQFRELAEEIETVNWRNCAKDKRAKRRQQKQMRKSRRHED